MFRIVCKTSVNRSTKHWTTTNPKLTPFSRLFSTTLNPTDQHSFTVSFLVNSCGLSLESAISASKLVNIDSAEKSDAVINLLKSYGFTKTQISTLISKRPSFILSNAEKILRPKIEFFRNLGFSGSDLTRIIVSNSYILASSLSNTIIPCVDFLRRYVETNENVVYTLKQSTWILRRNVDKIMVPKIDALHALGVPKAHINRLIMIQPRSLILPMKYFKEVVRSVEEMGFDPKRRSYILAVKAMTKMTKATWDKKKEIFMSYGWSEKEFHSAFTVQPMLMLCSEKKIRELLHFFIEKAGFKPSEVAKCPNLFLTSFEKRIIPRCAVLEVLFAKGLIKKNLNVIWMLNVSKKKFEVKFLTSYLEDAPEIIKAYRGELGFHGFGKCFKASK
ncbi:Transcription termination factor, mitochondrial/chloroplastic [Dillenia turbinata]|uniref:Transcription termination factor, mitochondrial/chloroplastic n=1 Tax=Dillenia turbinata TaxID=194707 RepID=A0AAN8VEJ7_9MAGN